ncbi:MAG: putative prefoldin subunit 2 [Streblomastix strix]|uniref:Putative prefoldin subunit 2 n=1 Tax=Streblomastix strix TaxID=222440 RepID=A0A5J4WPG9_9EUKA|nr:MAG: putative prefoldin subunit 2 [Streblomastix strix]
MAQRGSIADLLQSLRAELIDLTQKINELDGEKAEHKLVIETLTPMDPARKCFRLVGDVLVERTVGEFLPAIKHNYDGICGISAQLTKQLEEKEQQLLSLQKKHNLAPSLPPASAAGKETKQKDKEGILVQQE